jgi:hypothetical protein
VAWQVDDEGVLKIYDVIAKTLPSLEQLLAYVPKPIHKMVFYFSPDKFVPKAEPIPHLYEGIHLMVSGDWELGQIPFMVQPLSRC